MKHLLIPVSAIHPNPHRDFKRNPIRSDQVEKILDSIGRTGFWDNVVVREHPGKEGEYQLAYGHSRLEAVRKAGITEIRLPVADLSDWDMYCAMVDENETQQEITPAIAFENVETGVKLLEKALREIGEDGTEEQFLRALDCKVFPRGNTFGQSAFTQIRNAFWAQQGIGARFVTHVLPSGGMHPDIVNEVLNSLYGQQRSEAKRKEAQAKEKEATAKRKKAEAEKDEEEAARLRAEAEAAHAAAEKLKKEADKIGAGAIDSDILLAFDTPRQMSAFAAAVKSAGIPKSHHQAAMQYAKQADLSVRSMSEKLSAWWYEASGQSERDRKRAQKEEALKKFKRKYKNGDVGEFLLNLGEKISGITSDINIVLDAATHYENTSHKTKLCKRIEGLQNALERLYERLIIEEGEWTERGTPETNGATGTPLLGSREDIS